MPGHLFCVRESPCILWILWGLQCSYWRKHWDGIQPVP